MYPRNTHRRPFVGQMQLKSSPTQKNVGEPHDPRRHGDVTVKPAVDLQNLSMTGPYSENVFVARSRFKMACDACYSAHRKVPKVRNLC